MRKMADPAPRPQRETALECLNADNAEPLKLMRMIFSTISKESEI